MADKHTNKIKASSTAAIMKNPKLSKIIADAWEAPLGSTKRAKAKSVLKSIVKANKNYYVSKGGRVVSVGNPFARMQDGQGGKADVIGTLSQSYYPALQRSGTGMSWAGPATAAPVSQPYGTMTQGSGTVKNITGSIQQPTMTKPRTSFIQPVDGLFTINENGTVSNSTTPSSSNSNLKGILNQDYSFDKMFPATSTQAQKTSPTAPVSPTSNPLTYNPYTDPKNNKPGGSSSLGMSTVDNPTDVIYNNEPESDEDKLANWMQTMMDSGNVDVIEQWYESLDTSEKAYYKDVYNAVKSGIGPQTFAMKTMADKEAIAKMTGMKMEDINQIFPGSSGFLSENLYAIKDLVTKQFDLDNQYKRLTDAQIHGMTLTDDIQGYIRGNDEYLGHLDRLTSKAKSRIANMDTSNPNVAKKAQNYMNYLTVSSGRQTQRYVDFLNTAVNYHNARTAQLKSDYESSYQKASDEYQKSAAITSEMFQYTTNALQEMYNNVQNRTTIQRENEKYQIEKMTSLATYSNKILENSKLSLEIENGGSLADIKPVPATIDYSLGISVDDKTGTYVISEYNPVIALQSAQSMNQPVTAALNRYISANSKNIYDSAQTDGFLGEYGKYADVLKQMDPGSNEYLALENMLSGATYSGIKSYASSKKQSDIEDALDYLSGKGWFRVGMGDRDDFINNYGDKLGYMTGVIYDMFKAYKDAGTSDDKIKETLLGSGGTGASSILAKNLSNYLLASE